MRPPVRRSLLRPWSWWAAIALAVAALAVIVAFIASRVIHRPVHELVIAGATIHDGTGAPAYRGSIGIDGDRITTIYRDRITVRPTGRTVLVARGLDVAPGFIDTHSHADQNILGASGKIRANNFIGQGVTTIVTGNCGRSPVHIGRFRGSITVRGSNINVATLVGLNSVRSEVMKGSTSPATAAEIVRLTALVDAAMREGAAGVSTGAAYVPGCFASEDETVAQLRAAARHGGIFATHLRDEGNAIVDSVREAVRQSTKARIPLLISHFKVAGPANCSNYPKIERLLADAEKRGIPVYTDQYPYTASSSSLDLYLPDWYLATRGASRREILETPAGQLRLASYLRKRVAAEGFPDLSFVYVASYENDTTLAGMNLAQIAGLTGRARTLDGQLDLVMEMLRHGGAQMVYHNICGGLTTTIAARPTSMFGSDSAIRYSGGDYLPHPRGWGTFPRVIAQHVRRQGLFSLDEAIRRMTSLPARVFQLDGRGVIAPGNYADLVVFDADTIGDRATYAKPFLQPRGILHVIVNGKLVVTESKSLEKRIRGVPDVLPVFSGRFLAPKARTGESAQSRSRAALSRSTPAADRGATGSTSSRGEASAAAAGTPRSADRR